MASLYNTLFKRGAVLLTFLILICHFETTVFSQTFDKDKNKQSSKIFMSLNGGHSIISNVNISDIIIANPEIVDVVIKDPKQAYLIGKSVGVTNIYIVGEKSGYSRELIVEVSLNLSSIEKYLKELIPNSNIGLKAVGDSVIISGYVNSGIKMSDIYYIIQQYLKPKNKKIINLLKILNDQQVLLKVRVAEMQRTAIKNLATNSSFTKSLRGRSHNFSTTQIFPADIVAAATGAITINKLGLSTTSFSVLERQGLVKTLAEPTLTAITGETANFLAGGELPVPSGVDSSGNLVIDFREFGVALSFTPVVLSKKQISLRISTEVSRISEANKLVLPFGTANQTVDVLGLSIRRAESTVNLASGNSLMIAGLLQKDDVNQIDGMPWLKDIPVIGALFRSQAFNSEETELVVLVTAYIAKPVEPSQNLSLPTDGFKTASDLDFYLYGKLYKKYKNVDKTFSKTEIIQGPFGYILK